MSTAAAHDFGLSSEVADQLTNALKEYNAAQAALNSLTERVMNHHSMPHTVWRQLDQGDRLRIAQITGLPIPLARDGKDVS